MANAQRKHITAKNKTAKPKAMKYSLTAIGLFLFLLVSSIVVFGIYSTLNEEWPIVGSFVSSISK